MNLAAFYDTYWHKHGDSFDRQRLAMLARHVEPDETVLQVDCGPGVLAQLLTEKGAQVTATELSAEGTRRARARQVDIARVDLDSGNLPFPPASFDVVVCDSRMEHGVDFGHYLDECARVLKTGGKFIMSVPNIAHWRCRWWLLRGGFPYRAGTPTDWTHLRFFTLPDMRALWAQRTVELTEVEGTASLWAESLYPRWMRQGQIAKVYGRLTALRPSLFARDLVLVGRKR
jgi:methionine biosynthesis protein MetW